MVPPQVLLLEKAKETVGAWAEREEKQDVELDGYTKGAEREEGKDAPAREEETLGAEEEGERET